MGDCATGILIDIDTGDNEEKCTYTDTSLILSDFEEHLAKELTPAIKKYKSKSVNCPLEENKQNDGLVHPDVCKSINHPLRTSNSIPLVKKMPDKSSRNKNSVRSNEDRWSDIINCDGDVLLENEKFDFSISLSDDTSRTDDDVFYTQSEGSSEGRKTKTAVRKQMRKAVIKKQIQRNINQSSKENFEDSLQNSLSERIAAVNFASKCEETSDENVGERNPSGCSLVRQNTFTLSTDSNSSSPSKNQEVKKNQHNVKAFQKHKPQFQSIKPLSTRSVNRTNNSIEKQPKTTHAEYSSRNLTSKVTRLSTGKRSLKESEIHNSSHNENRATKKSNVTSLSSISSIDSNSSQSKIIESSSSQSKIIRMNSRKLPANGKHLNRPQAKKPEPVKAILPVNRMTKSGLRPPTKHSVSTKPESKPNKGSNVSRTSRYSQVITSTDSSVSFTPQRRSLNTSAIPTLTSTPNKRSTSNSSTSSTPSVKPFLKTSGLLTPIRSLNSSDIKI